MVRSLGTGPLAASAIIMPPEEAMYTHTYTLTVMVLIAAGCRASIVDVDSDDSIIIDDSEGEPGDTADILDDEDSDSQDENDSEGDNDADDDNLPDDDDSWDDDDDDRPEDDDEEESWYEGDVEINFDGSGDVFCSGEVWFYISDSKFYGEAECELQAGPGAGELLDLIFDGDSGGRGYEGTVSSDWAPPEGDGMSDGDFEAETRGRTLTVEWDSDIPLPEGAGRVDVEGVAEAQR